MRRLWMGAVVSMGVACASAPVPSERLTTSKSAIRAAEELGARDNPQAALHLQLAQDQTAAAEKAIADHENRKADYILQRAQADADLAMALAREAPLQAEVEKTLAHVKQVRDENSAKGNQP